MWKATIVWPWNAVRLSQQLSRACPALSICTVNKAEISCTGDRWEIMVRVCGCKPCLHVDLRMEDSGVLYMMKNGFLLVGLQWCQGVWEAPGFVVGWRVCVRWGCVCVCGCGGWRPLALWSGGGGPLRLRWSGGLLDASALRPMGEGEVGPFVCDVVK